MMIAPGDQSGARRRAQRSRVEVRVAQAIGGGDPIEVGITPPNVLETPKPVSSVMISNTLGAPLGGTTRAGQYGVDCAALRSIVPPKVCGVGGSCAPSMAIVAPGAPGVP